MNYYELVATRGRALLCRIHEIEFFMQVMPDRIVPGGDLADKTIHELIESKSK